MLNSFRNFSKSIWAKAVMIIIIIAFVTWGMGGVFSGGNTNTLAKINNINISTQDFIDHKNTLKISDEMIRNNIDKSIVEQILNDLINQKLLLTEIKELNIKIPIYMKKNLKKLSYKKFYLVI